MRRISLYLFFVCLPFFTRGQAHVDLSVELVACYSFTGNANDSSGNNHHGTIAGAQLTADRFGRLNHAYSFNGTSSINLPPDIFTSYLNFSWSLWVLVAQNPGDEEAQAIISVGQTGNRSSHFNQTVLNDYSSLSLTGFGTGGGVQGGGLAPIQTGSLPTTGVWYHLVTTRNIDTVRFYINGALFAAIPDDNLPAIYYQDPLAVAKLGLRSDGNQGLVGNIDAVAIYSRSINADEVMALYTNGSPCAPAVQAIVEKDIVACYSFSGNASDSSGNNYNGTVVGATLAKDRFGNANRAYSFNGTSSISLPPEVFTPYKNFSYSMWVSLSQNPFDGDAESIISVGQTGYRSPHFNQTVLNDYPSGGSTFTGFGTGGGVQNGSISQIQSGSLPVVNSWYFLVTTRDDDAVKFYINGELFTSVSDNSDAAIYYHDPLAIANLGLRSDGNQGFVGVIDDVTIYGRSIDANDVLKLYQKGSPCLTPVKPIVEKDIVACYSFSGNASDSSGNNYNGTVVRATLAKDRFGNANHAYSFNGTSSISLPPEVFTPYKNFSYSMWVSLSQNPFDGDAEAIISVGQTGYRSPHFNQTVLNDYPSGGSTFTGFGTGGAVQNGGISQIESGSLPALNTWYFLVTTRDDDAVKFYINGELFTSVDDNSYAAIYYHDPLAIANLGLRSDGNQGFVGVIDDVTIYGRAIDANDVMKLYQNGSPCITPVDPPVEDDIVACYSFTGNAKDNSGNSHDGTVTSASLTSDRFGIANRAYSFSGTSGINLPSEIFTQYRNFSYSLWVQVDRNPDYDEAQAIISIGRPDYRSAHFNQTVLNHYSSLDMTGFGTGGGVQGGAIDPIQTGVLPAVGVWYHLVTTRDDSTIKFYVNGTLVMSIPDNGFPAIDYHDPQTVANIGLRSDGNQGFVGKIDDVTIYGRTITQNEVTGLYTNGIPCTPAIQTPPDYRVPNVITANADTLNRILSVFTKDSKGDYTVYSGNLPFSMKVTNRYGQELFRSNDPVTGWDGSGVEAGVYFYFITISDRKFEGSISVLK